MRLKGLVGIEHLEHSILNTDHVLNSSSFFFPVFLQKKLETEESLVNVRHCPIQQQRNVNIVTCKARRCAHFV